MCDNVLHAPDTVPDTRDPGDETARRFRYQWTYAAILCCMLLDDTEDITEVFCEQHEDVLLKHSNGSFSGIQIKTRSTHQARWKTNDKEVQDSFVRFARLECTFPGQFRRFRFITNHPLYVARNGQDIQFILEAIRNATSMETLPTVASRVLTRTATKACCTQDIAFAALRKTRASDNLPKLDDIVVRLIDTLTEVWSPAVEYSYSSVKRAALGLVHKCFEASSLSHQDVLPGYVPVTAEPQNAELAARIEGKRIDRDCVLEILESSLNGTTPLLGDLDLLSEPGTGSTDLLFKKLEAGGFSAVSCNSADDLRNKADYLGLVWINKFGRQTGLQRYGHVRSLVLSDAGTAYEATKKADGKFGVDMRSELRSLFKKRIAEGDQLYGCRTEHLEGFVYSLTAECKVAWSIERPWEAV